MTSVLQWRSCINRCSRCNKPSTHRKLLAKQRFNLLNSKLSNKVLPSESGTSRGTSLPLAPPSTPLPALDRIMRSSLLSSAWCRKRCSTASQLKFCWITSRTLRESAKFSRSNGVPPDYVKCTLFPFSLDGKAARWLASLPTGILTTWE